MQKLIHKKNNILIDNKSNTLLNHEEVQAKKHSNKFKDPFTKQLNEDEIFIERTNNALKHVEEDKNKWLSFEEFLEELESW